ncbi:MAG: polyribonucleotide nucleotidyltransferase [Planctomycetes bacterium]|nr:polyribonucleotide nucleotidyltransferase [Planctomycetota bacterium]
MSNNIVQPLTVEREIAGVKITLSTGQMARQAQGSVICTVGDSSTFAAVCSSKPNFEPSFFPLTCDYREKTQAAGKIPGGFFKREGRPTTKEILTMRLIDRSIRPMFADGFMQEVQVMTHALGYDGVNNTDVSAMIGAFTAVRLAGLPFETTMGATRIGMIDGELVAFPKDEDLRGASDLNLVVAGHSDAIAMVEASANELSEAQMIDALEMAHDVIKEVIDLANELIEKVGVTPMEYVAPEPDTESADAVAPWADRVTEALFTEGKHARYGAVDAVRDACLEELTQGIEDEEELAAKKSALKSAFRSLTGQCERETILNGKRTDGRKSDEIRDIWIVPDYVAQHHGSVLFTRGETQALVSATLGTPDDEQIIDGIEEEYRKNFYLHYNFPPYSVGETKRIFGPGRREIGHGMLAERALQAVLPSKDKFPYTIRINSDITESNGSSSMASVCGGCISMMLAGVPVTQPVAGIAMGLVQEGDRMAILSDILGSEDHTGDMDFKVAGSGLGITALQMDIKIKGVSRALLEEALAQANVGRKHILREMLNVVDRPRSQVADHAPRFEAIKIPGEKIGFLIGPGGKNIKGLQEEFGVRVSIIDDDGNVQVFGTDSSKVAACIDRIQATCETPKIGAKYTGTVKSIRDFGAFVEILPGVEGLLHISELSTEYVENVNDVVSTGDSVEVVITNVDDRGKVRLMRQEVVDARNKVEA